MAGKRTRDTLAHRLLRALVAHARKHPGCFHEAVIAGQPIKVWAGEESDYLSIERVIRLPTPRQEHTEKIEQARTSLHLLQSKDDARFWLRRAREVREAA